MKEGLQSVVGKKNLPALSGRHFLEKKFAGDSALNKTPHRGEKTRPRPKVPERKQGKKGDA